MGFPIVASVFRLTELRVRWCKHAGVGGNRTDAPRRRVRQALCALVTRGVLLVLTTRDPRVVRSVTSRERSSGTVRTSQAGGSDVLIVANSGLVGEFANAAADS